jgi:hypothetical protein
VSTATELRAAYIELAATAPTRQSLRRPSRGRRRRNLLQVAGIAVAMLALVVVPAALIQRHVSSSGGPATSPAPASGSAPSNGSVPLSGAAAARSLSDPAGTEPGKGYPLSVAIPRAGVR